MFSRLSLMLAVPIAALVLTFAVGLVIDAVRFLTWLWRQR